MNKLSYEFWYKFLFLKCNHCGHRFAVRNGFYTVTNCPNCKRDIRVWPSGNNPQRIDDSISEEEKSMLINNYHFRKLELKLVR